MPPRRDLGQCAHPARRTTLSRPPQAANPMAQVQMRQRPTKLALERPRPSIQSSLLPLPAPLRPTQNPSRSPLDVRTCLCRGSAREKHMEGAEASSCICRSRGRDTKSRPRGRGPRRAEMDGVGRRGTGTCCDSRCRAGGLAQQPCPMQSPEQHPDRRWRNRYGWCVSVTATCPPSPALPILPPTPTGEAALGEVVAGPGGGGEGKRGGASGGSAVGVGVGRYSTICYNTASNTVGGVASCQRVPFSFGTTARAWEPKQVGDQYRGLVKAWTVLHGEGAQPQVLALPAAWTSSNLWGPRPPYPATLPLLSPAPAPVPLARPYTVSSRFTCAPRPYPLEHSDLRADGLRRVLVVAGDDHDADARLPALLDGGAHLGARGVLRGRGRQQRTALSGSTPPTN